MNVTFIHYDEGLTLSYLKVGVYTNESGILKTFDDVLFIFSEDLEAGKEYTRSRRSTWKIRGEGKSLIFKTEDLEPVIVLIE